MMMINVTLKSRLKLVCCLIACCPSQIYQVVRLINWLRFSPAAGAKQLRETVARTRGNRETVARTQGNRGKLEWGNHIDIHGVDVIISRAM